MSFAKKDRNSQTETGKTFPSDRSSMRLGAAGFATAISEALHREFDGSRSAVKNIIRLTGANERTVKNWLQGKNGPNGEFLILLCQNSEEILRTVLVLSGRSDLVFKHELIIAKQKLRNALAIIDEI